MSARILLAVALAMAVAAAVSSPLLAQLRDEELIPPKDAEYYARNVKKIDAQIAQIKLVQKGLRGQVKDFREQGGTAYVSKYAPGKRSPGQPSPWKRFSSSDDVNDSADAAMSHYYTAADEYEGKVQERDTTILRLQKEREKLVKERKRRFPRDDEEVPEPPDPGKGHIGDFEPIQVTATGQCDIVTTRIEGKAADVVTRNYVLKFWNIGQQANGYGHVTGRRTSTFSHHSAVYNKPCNGTFSGGPNGTFTLDCGKKGRTARLSAGTSIKLGKCTLTVQNPEAFDNWPSKYR